MWDLPRPGLEPITPALAGGFLTTAPTQCNEEAHAPRARAPQQEKPLQGEAADHNEE